MPEEQPLISRVRDAKDTRLLVGDRGTNPGGNRYVYDVIKQQGDHYTLINTRYLAVGGISSIMPNLHPRENNGQVVVSGDRLLGDFIKI